MASQHRVVPLSVDDGVLMVAVSNPFNTDLLNAVRFAARGPVKGRKSRREPNSAPHSSSTFKEIDTLLMQ